MARKKKVKRNPSGKFEAEKKQYKDFTGRVRADVTYSNVNWPKSLILIGKITDITYRSDKQVGKFKGGTNRDYIHYLKKHGYLFKDKNGKMAVILGISIKMKKEGITG